MGWSIRKSFKFGPVRINVSNRGISSSIGVKGARVSFSKRGTFLNLGLNGIHYKSRINSRSQSHHESTMNNISADEITDRTQTGLALQLQTAVNRKRLIFWLGVVPSTVLLLALLIYLDKPVEVNNTYTPWVLISKNSVHVRTEPSIHGRIIGSANISDQFRFIEHTENGWLKLWYDSSTVGYVNQDLGFVKPFLSSTQIIKPFQSTPSIRQAIAPASCLCLIAYCFWLAFYDRKRRTVLHHYQIDDGLRTLHEKFLDCFNQLSGSNKIWYSLSSMPTSESRHHAGASELVSRSEIVSISDDRKPIPFFKTNIKIPTIELRHLAMFFFPDQLIIKRGTSFVGIPYKEIDITSESVRFVETGPAPSDANIREHTWRYANKNGTPDRRFAGNELLPVCLYSQYSLQSGSDFDEVILTSKEGAMDNLASFLRTISRYQQNIV